MGDVTLSAGIDIGSTYTKAVILDGAGRIISRAMHPTGFQLAEAAERAFLEALEATGRPRAAVATVVATGYGRHQVDWVDLHVTDLTAAARGALALFPGTRTILDVGGQTMKASGVTPDARVKTFRLNDKCAAGTGAFLEKTARYMGYTTAEIGPLVATSKEPMQISGVCAVFAESEVINHLSQGAAPADIMHGAIVSLVGRSVQLMKRVKLEPEFTLIGGILRFTTMVDVARRELQAHANVPEGELVQFVPAFGAAILGRRRRLQLEAEHGDPASRHPSPA
jgi:predicted CoA-substrate-specific enzyme activase